MLLLDEPFRAPDPASRPMPPDRVAKVWRTTGKTISFVTQRLEEAT